MELGNYYWKHFIAHKILDYSLCNQNKSVSHSTVELKAAPFHCNIVGKPIHGPYLKIYICHYN